MMWPPEGSPSSEGRTRDRAESLDFAERWLADAFRVIHTPGGFLSLDVDVSALRGRLEAARAQGLKLTYNHMFIRAAALALAQNPELHLLVAGTARLLPARVDIGLSVAGSGSFAPVMIVEDAGQKNLLALAGEITRRVPEVREKEQRDLATLRRWGWLIPFGFLRRALLRWLFERVWFRRNLAGTFQVSCLGVDQVVPFLFNSAGALGVGSVRDRVVAVDGAPAVRPTCTLTCAIDHKAWDGQRAQRFLYAVRDLVERDALD
jgi:pyruvate dehydrogenase E2 component (dihydrolipoamide acetyltransferase)